MFPTDELRNLLDQAAVPTRGGPTLSAVLVPVGRHRDSGEYQILLTKRSSQVGLHKGQVGFPGGMHETQDPDLRHTALREAQEEVGLDPSHVDVLGLLPPVVTRFGIEIYPWVGVMEFPYPFVPSPVEVDRLLFLPLRRLLDEGLQQVAAPVGAGKLLGPGISVEGELVWGATARMLQVLRERLQSAGLE